MKLAEIDPANIDFHSMQNLEEPMVNHDPERSHITSGDKLFE
jgi:hypothetical protein